VECRQHVSWAVVGVVEGDCVGVAEVVGLGVGEVDVASCVFDVLMLANRQDDAT
jgi:hypothetical protein